MARQLRESGESVPHVIMLDTPQPTQPPLSFADKLSMKSQEFRRHKLGYVSRWLEDRARWQEEMRRKQEAEESQTGGPSEQFNNERIESAFRRALLRYPVRPYEGPVTVYRPRPEVYYRLSGGRRLMQNRNIVLDDNGWSEHVDDLNVVEVPGDHDSMVLEPHVRVLAAHLRRTIEQGSRSIAPAIIAGPPPVSRAKSGRPTVPA
jgi:thioesterase domain-containing protein